MFTFVSGQQLQQDEVDSIISKFAGQTVNNCGRCETQLRRIPWTEDDFATEMVKFGHPATLQTGLPTVLKDAIEGYRSMDAEQRMSFRVAKLGSWLKRLVELKDNEKELKLSMDPEVVTVVGQKNILLWQSMLQAVQYPDMKVVEELFQTGTDLVGCVEATGLWPKKFQPAVISVDELMHVAEMERGAIGEQFSSGHCAEFVEQVWAKTLDEVEAGALVGPIPLDQVGHNIPLSRRFGIQQGAKVRCTDDFSSSAVNSAVQS